MQEARAASALSHPNIVTLHDIAVDNGVDYLVMEYVDGTSLDKLILSAGLPLDAGHLGRGGTPRDAFSFQSQLSRPANRLAAFTIVSGVKPNFFCSSWSGADAPKVSMPMVTPAAPT